MGCRSPTTWRPRGKWNIPGLAAPLPPPSSWCRATITCRAVWTEQRGRRGRRSSGRNETVTFESRRGRLAKLGARSLGHIDAGAASAALILAAMRET
ncbi:DAK2 domain-containing protein [Shinella sumterensis]|nr:DAK2 domain-containing protein [Shinella sumterensis]